MANTGSPLRPVVSQRTHRDDRAAGVSTIVLASMKEVAERINPPRTLYCEFPLGRPLGRPDDVELQRDVSQRAFALLDSPTSVMETYPLVIESDEQPLSCSIPPRFDPSLPAAVDEVQGLRAAYDRSLERRGKSNVGRAIDVNTIPEALRVLDTWVSGAPRKENPLPGKSTIAVCHDIRTYYTEAALELAAGPAPGGRSVEAWFHDETGDGSVHVRILRTCRTRRSACRTTSCRSSRASTSRSRSG